MKASYTETTPEKVITHKIIVCDNQDCLKVITDNKQQIGTHHQAGDGKKILDFCSDRCMRKVIKIIKKDAPERI